MLSYSYRQNRYRPKKSQSHDMFLDVYKEIVY